MSGGGTKAQSRLMLCSQVLGERLEDEGAGAVLPGSPEPVAEPVVAQRSEALAGEGALFHLCRYLARPLAIAAIDDALGVEPQALDLGGENGGGTGADGGRVDEAQGGSALARPDGRGPGDGGAGAVGEEGLVVRELASGRLPEVTLDAEEDALREERQLEGGRRGQRLEAGDARVEISDIHTVQDENVKMWIGGGGPSRCAAGT